MADEQRRQLQLIPYSMYYVCTSDMHASYVKENTELHQQPADVKVARSCSFSCLLCLPISCPSEVSVSYSRFSSPLWSCSSDLPQALAQFISRLVRICLFLFVSALFWSFSTALLCCAAVLYCTLVAYYSYCACRGIWLHPFSFHLLLFLLFSLLFSSLLLFLSRLSPVCVI